MRPTDRPWPLRVLIVDDDRDTTDSLAALLKLWGFQPLVANDGPAALAAAAAGRPEVVLLDLAMPGMDGCAVALRLRQQPGAETIPLVALTGYGREEDRRHTRGAGFYRHLLKPVDPAELRRLLETCRGVAEPDGS